LCQLIGSSLLAMYDDNYADVWMIDFAKSPLVAGRVLTHRGTWQPGNHEEGYLTGLDSLVTVSRFYLHAVLLVHSQVTIIFVVSGCLFVQSFSQPSSIQFGSN